MGQENCPILHSNVSLTTIVAMLHMTAYCFTLQSVILTPHTPFNLSHPLLSLPFSIYISSLSHHYSPHVFPPTEPSTHSSLSLSPTPTFPPSFLLYITITSLLTLFLPQKLQPKTQLIAHDKEVYDIAFACGKDVFGTVGADGSLRMFDLRYVRTCLLLCVCYYLC